MKIAKRCKNQDLWLTSYADLVTAILSVMILVVSFSKLDIEKYDMIQKLIVEQKERHYS
jgi:flagellar motor protein MotB